MQPMNIIKGLDMFSLRLPKEHEKRLERLALLRDKSKTALVVEAVEALLSHADEFRDEQTNDEINAREHELRQRQYEEFQKRITEGNDKIGKQIEKIFDWMAKGNVWTKKPTIDATPDGCPYGTNYITGYTLLNEGSSEQVVAVVSKNTDGPRGIQVRFRRVIPFDVWVEKMHELDCKI